MLKHFRFLIVALVFGLPGAGVAAEPRDVRLEISSRIPAYGGASFGEYGPYERIAATAHMRIDPTAADNLRIVDLALAPRNAEGLVEYDIDVIILRPRNAATARSMLLYDVVNRGIKLLSMLNQGSPGSRDDPIDRGDGLLMRQGYTMVWSGWQGDIAGPGLVGARFPIATHNGGPITGLVSTERIFDNTTGNRISLPYPAANRDQSKADLTVRARGDDPPQVIDAKDWAFEDERHITLKRPADMDAGAIYRFEYVAKDPRVMGLGFAATRDLISFLRHASAAEGNPLADLADAPCERDANGACVNPTAGIFSTAVAIGASQSGRYLRDFLWQGFNRDLAGRRVFDGIIPMIPGGRQTFTNFRFAEPGRFSRQHEDHNVPGFTFPFAYTTLTDPVTGRRDGIMRSCASDGTCPKLFHIDTGAEFWSAAASLVGTGGTGKDVAFPANMRAYMIASAPHAPGRTADACSYPANPISYTQVVRALMAAMVDWTTERQEPPASRWPTLAKGELLPVDALRGPEAPSLGISWAKVVNRPVPPVGRPEWPVLLPAIDADGNDLPGIRMPQVAAPTGTYLGWNLRKPGYSEGELCLVYGSYLPFARDAASRGDDPRRSLAERYPNPDTRAMHFMRAIETLRRERLLLDEDARALAKEAIEYR